MTTLRFNPIKVRTRPSISGKKSFLHHLQIAPPIKGNRQCGKQAAHESRGVTAASLEARLKALQIERTRKLAANSIVREGGLVADRIPLDLYRELEALPGQRFDLQPLEAAIASVLAEIDALSLPPDTEEEEEPLHRAPSLMSSQGWVLLNQSDALAVLESVFRQCCPTHPLHCQYIARAMKNRKRIAEERERTASNSFATWSRTRQANWTTRSKWPSSRVA